LRVSFSIILSLLFFTSCSQGRSEKLPVIDTLVHTIGETKIVIKRYTYEPASNLFIIKLHDNEQTAEEAANEILKEYGGVLLVLESNNERLVQFQKGQQQYRFDPNRMFSDKGIEANLKTLNSFSPVALNEINRFADFVLKQIPDSVVIVAVHNNTDERFSIDDYLQGGSLVRDANTTYKSDGKDADDFILTTDSVLYRHFVQQNINAVLQNNTSATDDGSLSVYYGKNGRSYLNIETQHQHLKEQIDMLRVLTDFLRKYKEAE
jgi:hypothetical protein